MDTYRRSGIVTGILFIAATAAGVSSLFAQPIMNAPDYLTRIAANEPKLLAGALLVFIMAWADAGIGIAMFPVLRRHNEGIALGAASFRIIDGAFHALAAVLVLLLVSLSGEFVSAGPAAVAQFQTLGSLLRASRMWLGEAALMAWCIGALLYYALFYRARLVPRWLSVWGLAGITVMVAAILLVLFRRLPSASIVHTLMTLPIAVQEMVLAVWLIVRGFDPAAAFAPRALSARNRGEAS